MTWINQLTHQMTAIGKVRPASKLTILVILPLFLLSTLLILNHKASYAAPTAQTRARTVQGNLSGGAYTQIWLGLEPEFADAQITVLVEWDRLFPADNGLNFFIFDEQQLRRLGEENNTFSALALAAGSANFALSTPDNVLGAGFRATGWAAYALVVLNQSAQAAAFTLRVTNGFVTDTTNQVAVLDPPLQPAPTAINTPFSTVTNAMTPTPVVTPSPVISQTAIITNTVSLSATYTPPATPTKSPRPTLQPVARSSLGRNKREVSVSGTLTTPSQQQLVRLKPHKANGQLLLRLAANNEATASTAADGLNFWVFDEVGFAQYLTNGEPSELALSTGKTVFRSASQERVAGLQTGDTAPYTVVIYSRDATLPISYTLRIEGAELLENIYLP